MTRQPTGIIFILTLKIIYRFLAHTHTPTVYIFFNSYFILFYFIFIFVFGLVERLLFEDKRKEMDVRIYEQYTTYESNTSCGFLLLSLILIMP